MCKESNGLARTIAAIRERSERDGHVIDLANRHVCLARHIRAYFSSRAAAYRAIKRLGREGQLKRIGAVSMKPGGRPEIAYCNSWQPKQDQLRHEVLLTDFCQCYPEANFVRGWQVNEKIRPDAEMTLNGQKFFVELDTGTESHRQIRDRMKAYSGVDDLLLFVTVSKRRIADLKESTKQVHDIILFASLEQVIADSCGDIWIDAFDNRASICNE